MNDVYRTAPVPTLGQTYDIGRTQGVKAEQERIIKLLEDLSNPKIPMGQLHIPGYQMREVIALIKGEK